LALGIRCRPSSTREGEHQCAISTARGKDGSVQTERLRETMPDHRAYHYEMVSTATPVTNYVAEFGVDDIGDGTSKVRWQAAFDVTVEPGPLKG